MASTFSTLGLRSWQLSFEAPTLLFSSTFGLIKYDSTKIRTTAFNKSKQPQQQVTRVFVPYFEHVASTATKKQGHFERCLKGVKMWLSILVFCPLSAFARIPRAKEAMYPLWPWETSLELTAVFLFKIVFSRKFSFSIEFYKI